MQLPARFRLGLRSKIALTTGSLSVVGGALFVVAAAYDLRSGLEPALHDRGAAVARYVAARLAVGGLAPEDLQPAARAALTSIPHAAYVAIRDGEGRALADEHLPGLPPPPAEPGGAAERGRDVAVGGVEIHDVTVPVRAAPATASAAAPGPARPALVQVGVRRDPIDAALADDFRRTLALAAVLVVATAALAAAAAWGASRRLREIRDAAAAFGRGELDRPIPAEGHDEVADLARSFAAMGATFGTVGRELNATADEIRREAATVLSTSSAQTAASAQQESALRETNAIVERLARTSRDASGHVQVVLERADRLQAIANDGERVVEDVLRGLEGLGERVRAIAQATAALDERSRQIEDVIEVAEEIAEESNLLALNAAIEASRAGEHGLGFGVVAQEMRGLAEGSKAASARIRLLLSEIRRGTEVAVAATGEGSRQAADAAASASDALARFGSMAAEIREGADAARQIAEGTLHQGHAVGTIATAMGDLSAAMTESLASARRIEQTAARLDEVAKRLTSALQGVRA